MMNKQKIIIEAFGLQNVKIQNLHPTTSLLEGANQFTQYNGLVPKALTPDPSIRTSVLGTPVFDNLVIAKGSYVDTTYGLTTYNEMTIDACLITLTQTNNVILTPIQGRDGEVIEYVSKMSFRINVKGGIFGTGNRRPFSEISNLKLILQSNDAISVVANSHLSGGFLSEWDISQFVIVDKTIPQTMGGYNYQLFEFNAIQDIPVILAQQSA